MDLPCHQGVSLKTKRVVSLLKSTLKHKIAHANFMRMLAAFSRFLPASLSVWRDNKYRCSWPMMDQKLTKTLKIAPVIFRRLLVFPVVLPVRLAG